MVLRRIYMLFVKTRKRVFLALLVTMIVSSSFYGCARAGEFNNWV